MRRLALELAACLLVLGFVAPSQSSTPADPMHVSITRPNTGPVRWTVLEQAIKDQGRWYAFAASHPVVRAVPSVQRPPAVLQGSGACGGSLPPCSVMWCESRGNLRAQNPRSSASGKWQILDSTWAGYGGYAHAKDAPEAVQDERARQIYAGGRGRSQWVC